MSDFLIRVKNGINGATPTIGVNGNWWINGVDTTLPSRGGNGTDGQDGKSVWIKYNTLPQDSGATITWSSDQHYIGVQTALAATHPATGYTWSLFIPEGKQPVRTATLVVGFTDDCDYNITKLGTTNNAQTTINAAITALPENGGKIILREGTYNITALIDVWKDNVVLEGVGKSTVLKRRIQNINNIIYVRASNCIITNIYIDGSNTDYSASNVGITITGNNNIITGNICDNTTNSAISVGGANNSITNNMCSNNMNNAISVGSNHSVVGNICNNNGSTYVSGNGSIRCESNNVIVGNICSNNTCDFGIACVGENNTITGNVCSNNRVSGVRFDYSGCKNNIFANNVCNNNTQYGVQLAALSSYTIVAGNQVYNNGTTAIFNAGTGNLLRANKNGATLIEN